VAVRIPLRARLVERSAPAERVKAWRILPRVLTILPRALTVASGELTPTLKVKRPVLIARFGDLVEEMYAQ
jgi:long-chain acyl-CoA synthetase